MPNSQVCMIRKPFCTCTRLNDKPNLWLHLLHFFFSFLFFWCCFFPPPRPHEADTSNHASCEKRSWAYTQPDLLCWRVGSCCPVLMLQQQQRSQSSQQKLPAWQQNTFTDRAFYYFYLTLCQPQPWREGSPTLRDAPIRSAAVSPLAFQLLSQGGFSDASSHHPDTTAINCRYLLTCCRSIFAPLISSCNCCDAVYLCDAQWKQDKQTLTLIIWLGRITGFDAAHVGWVPVSFGLPRSRIVEAKVSS